MNESAIKIINLIIAPVVLITACGIMLNGLILRYNWLSDRVRLIYHEQRNLSEGAKYPNNGGARHHQHLEILLNSLLRHHHQLHDVLVLVYIAIIIFMLDMLLIALAVSNYLFWSAQIVIVVFLIGVAILLWAVVLIAIELRNFHDCIQLEVEHKCPSCAKSSFKTSR